MMIRFLMNGSWWVIMKFLSVLVRLQKFTTALPAVVSRTVVVASIALVYTAPLYAHDFWIEPINFQPASGEEVPLLLRVGQDLSGDRLPYINDWFSDYRVIAPDGVRPIDGLMGDDPAGSFRASEPGLYMVGYRSTLDFVELDAKKFNSYLRNEGLDQIIELRRERGQSDQPAPEYYSRCAKSLIRAGEGGSVDAFSATIGYTLELVPEANPYALAPGDQLPIQLLYQKAPIENILVVAFTADSPENKSQLRTDADGRVSLLLDRPGLWLIKAVHMIETPPSVTTADWESFWASLTFRLPAGTPESGS
jgi:uncharacterized GH25 family protein